MTRRRRMLMIGEDYGNSPVEYHEDMYALTGASGRRLADLCGYGGEHPILGFALDFERTNVVELPEDWKDRAKVRASVLDLYDRMRGRDTLLLGSRVARAFDASDWPLFTWGSLFWTDTRVARIPHPSGRSHWWNDPTNEQAAREFLQDLVAGWAA